MAEVNKIARGKIACSCCGKVLDNRVYHFCPWCGTRQTQNDGAAQVAFPNEARVYFCPSCHNYVQLDDALRCEKCGLDLFAFCPACRDYVQLGATFRCERCGLDFFAPTGDNTVYTEDDDN